MLREAFAELASALDAMIHLSPGQQAAVELLRGPARYVNLVGGTRSGKTFLICREVMQAAADFPGSRHALLRFRSNAAKASLFRDTVPAVRRKCFPHITLEENKQDLFFELPNGSQIWIGGLDDKERTEKILGQEYATILLNEASQIPYSSVQIAVTRLAQVVPGLQQRMFIDLNPVERTHWTNALFGEKRDPVTKLPLKNPDAYARAFLNPIDNEANLSADYLESLRNLPERARKRFYEGVYAEEREGALWKPSLLERCRIAQADVPAMKRIVVGVDPATSSGETANETGIIVAGLGVDDKGYVLADGTGRYSPTEWARKAITLYEAFSADRVVAETNQGGSMVETTVRSVDPSVSYRGVHASKGKIARAEPISALYEAGRVLHVGDGLSELEDQMTSYVTGMPSPDRFDAMVWALSDLMIRPPPPVASASSFAGRRLW